MEYIGKNAKIKERGRSQRIFSSSNQQYGPGDKHDTNHEKVWVQRVVRGIRVRRTQVRKTVGVTEVDPIF